MIRSFLRIIIFWDTDERHRFWLIDFIYLLIRWQVHYFVPNHSNLLNWLYLKATSHRLISLEHGLYILPHFELEYFSFLCTNSTISLAQQLEESYCVLATHRKEEFWTQLSCTEIVVIRDQKAVFVYRISCSRVSRAMHEEYLSEGREVLVLARSFKAVWSRDFLLPQLLS